MSRLPRHVCSTSESGPSRAVSHNVRFVPIAVIRSFSMHAALGRTSRQCLFRQSSQSHTVDKLLDQVRSDKHRVLSQSAQGIARNVSKQFVHIVPSFIPSAELSVSTSQRYQCANP